ncbi:Multicopper oxidase [Mycena kentingensis (nom. inval.)]|nr:Multicopper oxidase [Mycena kentingensis (nom. inval.)]
MRCKLVVLLALPFIINARDLGSPHILFSKIWGYLPEFSPLRMSPASGLQSIGPLSEGNAPLTIGPRATLEIVNAVISPDGFARSTVLAGGTFPATTITGTKGDRFEINVVNRLEDTTMLADTTIHWHGLHQRGSSFADGTSFITQCPITPQHSFLYSFETPEQAGTYWYHSHLGSQSCDGLRGAFIIYDPADPAAHLYDIDDASTVLTIADWYHAPSIQQHKAVSTLINGQGRYPGGPASPLAVVNVSYGKRYRFRLISMSCDAPNIFSIDSHPLTIIEVDGVNHQPLVVDSIEIFAGQRYSFILDARQRPDNYWIRVPPNGSSPPKYPFANGVNLAILRYDTASREEPPLSASLNSKQPLVETDLHPLVAEPVPGRPVPGGADVNIYIDIQRNLTTKKWFMNGVNFVPPKVPVLLQVLSGAKTALELLPKGAVYTLPANKSIEISMPGGMKGAPHPMHLHGHTFHVVRSAGNESYNFENPVIRDVVSLGRNLDDRTTFRFITDNAGPWFLHCHIDDHLEDGMAVVLVEDAPKVAEELEYPPVDWDELCPIYDKDQC